MPSAALLAPGAGDWQEVSGQGICPLCLSSVPSELLWEDAPGLPAAAQVWFLLGMANGEGSGLGELCVSNQRQLPHNPGTVWVGKGP